MRGERGDVAGREVAGPAPERGGAGAAEPRGAFLGAHTGVENFCAGRGAVVVHVNDERVAGEVLGVEECEQATDVFVDVVDHAEEMSDGLGVGAGADFALVEGGVLGAGGVGRVRGVGRDTGEERTIGFLGRFDPARGLGKKDIGAEAGGFRERAVVADDGIEVGVAGDIAAGAGIGLADAAAAVDEDLVEAAGAGLIGGFVAEMPFPKNAGGVTGGFQDLSEGGGVESEALAFEDGVGDAVFEFVTAGEERGASGRASGADVEIGEAHALSAESVEVGRLEDGISVSGKIAVALIVGDDEENVGARGGGRGGGECGEGEKEGKKEREEKPPWI